MLNWTGTGETWGRLRGAGWGGVRRGGESYEPGLIVLAPQGRDKSIPADPSLG